MLPFYLSYLGVCIYKFCRSENRGDLFRKIYDVYKQASQHYNSFRGFIHEIRKEFHRPVRYITNTITVKVISRITAPVILVKNVLIQHTAVSDIKSIVEEIIPFENIAVAGTSYIYGIPVIPEIIFNIIDPVCAIGTYCNSIIFKNIITEIGIVYFL